MATGARTATDKAANAAVLDGDAAYGEAHTRLVTPWVELLGRQIYVVATIILYFLFSADVPATQHMIWLVVATIVIGSSMTFDAAYLIKRPSTAQMVRKWRRFDKWLTPALDMLAVATIFLLMPFIGPQQLLIGTAFYIGYIPMQILSDPENIRANQFSTIVVLGSFAAFIFVSGGELGRYLAILVILYASFLYLAAGQIRALVLDAVIGRRYAVIEERQRFMRELHDGIGNQLLGLKIKLRHAGGTDAAPLAEDVQAVIAELRLVTTALDESDGHLAPVLSVIGERLGAQAGLAGIRLGWVVNVDPALALPQKMLLDVLRIVQECIGNALKHAGASVVDVAIAASGRLIITVTDDGCGFDPAAVRAGMGLRNLRARAAAWGGAAAFAPAKGGGTQVRIDLPLPAAA